MAVTTAHLGNTGTCLGGWDIMQLPQDNPELVEVLKEMMTGCRNLGELLQDARDAAGNMENNLVDRMQCTNRGRQGSKTSLHSCNDRYRTPLYEGYILVTAYCIAHHAGHPPSGWRQ